MKKILNIIVLICIIIGISACEHEGTPVNIESDNVVNTSQSNDYSVVKLFSVDGITVYRFYDNGYKYFTSKSGSVSWEEKEGKSTVYKEVNCNEMNN